MSPAPGSVVVIGAGFAGLAAAERLAAAGWEVTVLEARERVGGRVWSQRFGSGIIERGGEFITTGYDETERTAARLGIALTGMGINYPDRELRPGPGPDAAALRDGAEAAAKAGAAAAAGTPAAEVLADAVADELVRGVLATRLQSAIAHPIAELDARFLNHAPHLTGTAEARRLDGGNQRLAEGLAARLPAPVRTGAAVAELRREAGGVRALGDRFDVSATAAVVAIPLPLLGELRFDPPLPARQVEAIAAIPTSRAAKLAVPLRRAEQPRALFSAADHFWAWTTKADGSGGRIAGAWAGSEPVLERLEVAAGPGPWLDALATLWPEIEADLDRESALVTDWRPDPWARGAYSVLPGVADERGDAARAAPAANVVFAGEHTAEPEWTGTMEGALRSGIRAAEELLGSARGPVG